MTTLLKGPGRCVLAVLLSAVCVLVAGCGSDAAPQSDNYGNLLASPGACFETTDIVCHDDSECPPGEACAALVVVRAEHPTGWMRPDCFSCHEIRNIHAVNRTDLPDEDVNLAGVRAIVRNLGVESCPQCHGTNGVEP